MERVPLLRDTRARQSDEEGVEYEGAPEGDHVSCCLDPLCLCPAPV